MKVTHDLICKVCNTIYEDVFADHTKEKFECCGKPLEICFRECPTMKIFTQDAIRSDGTFQRARVCDDPLIQQELGLVKDDRYACMPDEARREYLEKYMKDGDSPELRNEISELSSKFRKEKRDRKTTKKRPKAYLM